MAQQFHSKYIAKKTNPLPHKDLLYLVTKTWAETAGPSKGDLVAVMLHILPTDITTFKKPHVNVCSMDESRTRG